MLSLVFLINIIAAVLLTLTPLWFSRRYLKLPVINPYTIALAVALPVQLMKLFAGPLLLIENGLFDRSYQFALLMGNLLVCAQTLGMVFFFKLFSAVRIERYGFFKQRPLSRRSLRNAARLLLLIFGVSLYLLAAGEFGVLNWLANPRAGYQLYRTGQGHWYAIATSSLSASYLLFVLANPTARAVLVRTMLFLGLGYLLGSKFMLLSIFTSALTFLWFIKWRHLKSLFLVGGPMVFGLAVWNLYLATGDGFELATIVEYFDYYKNAADYYRDYLSGDIQLYWGDLTLSSFWAYVPRALWPDKPVVYGILLVDEIFYPGAAEMTSTPAFGGGVEQFADFGVPGLVFSGFFGSSAVLTALLGYLMFKRPGIDFNRVTIAAVAILLIQFAPGYGLYFPGMLYFALLLTTLMLVRLARGLPPILPRPMARTTGTARPQSGARS